MLDGGIMNCACFIDLGAAKLDFSSYSQLLADVGAKYEQVKFYGYNAKRNGDFNPYIREVGAEVALPLHNRKKVRVDIRQVVDAIACACKNPNIDAILLVCAEVDALPMIAGIKAQGKKVLIAVESESAVSDRCDACYVIKKSVTAPVEAAAENGDFLPYTGIERDKDDGMDDVREKLKTALDRQAAKKPTTVREDGDEELVRLLSKYF